MSDLISRQAAIIQLSHNKNGDDGHDVIVQKDIETIKQLPSAEPEKRTDKRAETHSCDLIDRRDAIDAVRHAWAKGLEPTQYLEELPSAESEPKWIPVSERLPEEGERVLVTHLGGLNPERQVIEHIYSDGKFLCGWEMDMDVNSSTFGKRYMGDVVAWMPLPAPYQGGEQDG